MVLPPKEPTYSSYTHLLRLFHCNLKEEIKILLPSLEDYGDTDRTMTLTSILLFATTDGNARSSIHTKFLRRMHSVIPGIPSNINDPAETLSA